MINPYNDDVINNNHQAKGGAMKKWAVVVTGALILGSALYLAGCSTALTSQAPYSHSSTNPFPDRNDKIGLTAPPEDPALSQMPTGAPTTPTQSLADIPSNLGPTAIRPNKAPAMPRKGGGSS